MPYLFGKVIAEEIQKEHKKRVQALEISGIKPKLLILHSLNTPVIETYIRLKKRYAEEIGVLIKSVYIPEEGIIESLKNAETDTSITGVIVQLPLLNTEITDSVLSYVPKEKDVDALTSTSPYTPATPKAILTLLEKNNVSLIDLPIVIVGKGRLVGEPLSRLLSEKNIPHVALEKGDDVASALSKPCILITATGSPGVIKNEMIKEGSIIVDAGTAVENGQLVGDTEPSLKDRSDILITPQKGGVGPLTICSLFDNLLLAAERVELRK